MENGTKDVIYGILSEISFFALLYYIQALLGVDTNLWMSSLILWTLTNLSIVFCPLVRKYYR